MLDQALKRKEDTKQHDEAEPCLKTSGLLMLVSSRLSADKMDMPLDISVRDAAIVRLLLIDQAGMQNLAKLLNDEAASRPSHHLLTSSEFDRCLQDKETARQDLQLQGTSRMQNRFHGTLRGAAFEEADRGRAATTGGLISVTKLFMRNLNPTARDVAVSTFAGVGAEEQDNDPAGGRHMSIQTYTQRKSFFHVEPGSRLDHPCQAVPDWYLDKLMARSGEEGDVKDAPCNDIFNRYVVCRTGFVD